MDEEVKKKYIAAGKVLSKALAYARKILIPGVNLFEAAEKIEEFIHKEGAKPAFPVNLSLNENAAHETPGWNSDRILEEEDVLKVDIGVHIDGYIADAAITLNYSGKHAKIIEACKLALEKALSIASNGTIAKIGATIEKVVREHNFKPIANLTGHGLERFTQHAKPSIPNIANNLDITLANGHVYAIEPFASTGSGHVRESSKAEIFSLSKNARARSGFARTILKFVAENYASLPFAERWLYRELKLSEFQIKAALRELLRNKALKAYPILHDISGSIVAQAENSFIKEKDSIILLVNRDDN